MCVNMCMSEFVCYSAFVKLCLLGGVIVSMCLINCVRVGEFVWNVVVRMCVMKCVC